MNLLLMRDGFPPAIILRNDRKKYYDALNKANIACFGPSKAAAQIEGSKDFAKQVMRDAGVPTAKSFTCNNQKEIEKALDTFGAPYVVKHDGLAAGKGVVVAMTMAEAEAAVDAIEITEHRVMSALSFGRNPGPMSSMLKTQGTEMQQVIEEIAVEITGAYAAVDHLEVRERGSNQAPIGPEGQCEAMARYLNGRAASIYGGSNEIQRGLIARLMLGL